MIRLRFFFFLSGLLFLLSTCIKFTGNKSGSGNKDDIKYRSEMVTFVSELKSSALEQNPDFFLIAQNGEPLVTQTGTPEGTVNQKYMNAIDGISREGLFYGYPKFDQPTDPAYQQNIFPFLDYVLGQNKKALVVNYCSTYTKQVKSYNASHERDYISFAAPGFDLNSIPTNYIFNENYNSITTLSQAQNFVYVTNTDNFSDKREFLSALQNTNYDLIIIDPSFHRQDPFTLEEIESLKTKTNGARRLVVAHMNIGEAETYRFYWNENWLDETPDWLSIRSSDENGYQYPVQYWQNAWKDIIYASDESYLRRILQSGFDGVYLEGVTSFYHFEN